MSRAKVAVSIQPSPDRSARRRPSASRPRPRHRQPERSWLPYASPPVAWTAAAVAFFTFGIYLRTLLPGTGFWDTAEAQTVPHTLSIFHPTGFPTYTLIGWLWSQLPIGSVAWRMNLMSAVCLSLTAGLVVAISAHLIGERNRLLVASSAGIAGLAFAFASEPWKNALRADVHALHILLAALIIWLLFCWRDAEVKGGPRAGGWLMAAGLVFGLGMGNHPLIGLMAFGIAFWVVLVAPGIWRRWKLVIACAGLLLVGLAVYLYIPIRALIPPEPPLFYARPTTLEKVKYLVFAEQFKGLFDNFANPFDFFGDKWRKAESVLAAQLIGPGWIVVAMGAATLAVRRLGAFIFLASLVAANVYYSLNFQDGDIDRYYMLSVLVAALLLAVAIASLAVVCARAAAIASRRFATIAGRRTMASVAAVAVLALAALLPAASLVIHYAERDQSAYTDPDRWAKSVYAALPPDAVVISWWSYSTTLWYHRWINGERPDVKIIDERNILDDGYGTIDGAIRAFLGKRPVFLVAPDWELQRILLFYTTTTVPTYAGYTELLRIEDR
ncbi:MAG: DUF2723 domain-containing protein [Chloroflexota bacterium]|nr:DUF2723 domain-containing protein [Chloroflexota bacterium]